MSIEPGILIGDYQVIGQLGAGGIGQVYQVRHTISHRIEAMKVLLPQQLAAQDTTDRFLREIRMLASLSHPNIASLHTAFRHEGQLMMIMEYVEGDTLRVRLRMAPITIGQSLAYARQVLIGLIYAHGMGVVHRDIKPSNIMITRGDHVKLLDFGLALSDHATEHTRTGLIMGSPHYMSPEQVMGGRVDARTDIYSMGVTLYQLLTGRPPIDGPSDYAIATAHLHEVPVPPMQINSALPASLSDTVMRSLAKAPADRFQTALEFLDALELKVAEETMTLVVPTLTSPRESSSQRLKRAEQSSTPMPTPTTSASRESRTLTGASVLENVAKELAQYVGPIARILVNRAATRTATLDQLYAAVVGEIGSDPDRNKFLATRVKYKVEPPA
jgi:serine/threonine protein kinase